MTEESKKILLDRIESVANEYGWSFYHHERFSEKDSLDIEFSKCSPGGHDFTVSAIMKDYDPSTLVESLKEGYEGYDPDYETTLWIGEDGHGKNGAPYHVVDIYHDMVECDTMYAELRDIMEKEFENYEFDDESDDEEED